MKQLKWIGKILITGVLLYTVYRKIDISRVWQTVRHIQWWPMLLALTLYVVSRFLGALRFKKIAESTGVVMSAWFNLRLYWIGMFYSLLLPGGIGGDAYKIYFLKKRFLDHSTLRLTSLVLWDRIIGLFALVLIAAIPASVLFLDELWKWSWIAVVPAVIFITAWAIKKWRPSLHPVYFPLLIISAGIQVTQVLCFIAIMNTIGVHDKYPGYALLFLASSIASMLPVTVGGIGLRALTFMYGTKLLFIAQEPAVAGSFLFDAMVIAISLTGGFMLFKKDKKIRQDIIADSSHEDQKSIMPWIQLSRKRVAQFIAGFK